MRSRCRTLLVALVAVLAFGALASAAASAAWPEFRYTSKYPDKFKGTINPPMFDTVFGRPWGYHGGTISGEITGPNSLKNITLTFVEGSESWSCNNREHKGLVLEGLTGRLGYINKAEHKVGLLLQPVKQPIANCTEPLYGRNRMYMGDIIAPITQVNTLQTKFELRYNQVKGIQDPLWFEGEKEGPETFPLTLGKWNCTKFEWEGKKVEHCARAGEEEEELGIETGMSFTTEYQIEIQG
jgi:hypothetical protein